MLGAIIGDIAGSRYEFTRAPKDADFELFAPKPLCNFTDDTICTVAIADAALNGREYRDALLDWCRRYPDPMGGYGNMFHHWLNERNPLPQSSFGNGAAMRVSSVGWLFDDYSEVQRQAKLCTEVSHCHAEGIRGAQCVATVIYWLRTCRLTKNEIENAVRRTFGYTIPPMRDIVKIGSEGHFDATCQETVPYALRCFLDSESFEETIRNAILADGDTDTKAAIAGSIAEAYYQIPDDMAAQALGYLPDDLLRVVEQFYNQIHDNINT